MRERLRLKLNQLADRYEEIKVMSTDPEIINQRQKYTQLMQEMHSLSQVILAYEEYQQLESSLSDAKSLLEESDPELRELAAAEVQDLQQQCEESLEKIQWLLIPKDPDDQANIYLEIRAGTGGEEASLFAADLMKMYMRFAENQGWSVSIISESLSQQGGYKEVVLKINGQQVYATLKFESGAHRVQRVPSTESQGRVHTSACTVAVLPEASEVNEVTINSQDLRIDTYRASGAGGQHVNKTDSAIRITHLPSGMVVECQEERSQHKNKAKAMSLLQSRLTDHQRREQQDAIASERKNLVGSGDRSEKIRTYNYPQNRVSDHRIELTLYCLDEIMSGRLQALIDPLLQEHRTQLLSTLQEGQDLD